MIDFLKKQSPARIIAAGFVTVILIGSLLLMMPFSLKDGVELNYVDALYTSASAVCVTGLVVVDTGVAFSAVGQTVIAVLIQIGGLGVAAVGAGIIIAMHKKLDIKGRTLISEASNVGMGDGILKFLKLMFLMTLTFELIGTALSFIVFSKDYPTLEALGHSVFHSIASFNNAGFDNLGLSGDLYNNVNLIPYADNALLSLTTCGLVIFGGIGFLLMFEVAQKRFAWKKFSMQTKVVLATTAVLLVAGTLLIKLTENVTWLEAFFISVSVRTAGFSTYNAANITSAGLLIMMLFMFVGASPGSTGGGIKTTSLFVLLQGIKSAATNKSEKAFKYSLPSDAFRKAAIIAFLGIGIILTGTVLVLVMDPQLALRDALFEMVSAFGTVGLSTGITPTLSAGSKILSVIIMYIGRLGPLTIATLWYFDKGERVRYPYGNIAIG